MLLCETMLYRGDASHVAGFDFDKTAVDALFGPGLYLTADPEVAHDYTAARGDERVWPKGRVETKATTVKALLHQYVEHEAQSVFDARAFEKRWRAEHHYGENAGMPEGAWNSLKADSKQALADAMSKAMPEALARVRAQMAELRVVKLTTGELVLVHSSRPAALSGFDIPEEYLAKVLHAERPLPDKVLRALRKLWLAAYPNDTGDLRDGSNRRVKGFDRFVALFRSQGTRRAWAEDGDPMIGGKGENPSLDDLRNGTHGGHVVFTDTMFDEGRPNSMSLIRALMKLGYVGLEYDGGKRMGQYVRGGGGRAHRAYVLWDVRTVNGFRRENLPMPTLKGVSARSMPKAAVSPAG